MCGIVGYVGKKNATPFLIGGLRALEYRGYDSAGVYVAGRGTLKKVGRVETLASAIPEAFSGNAGIAHTRWATHGAPTENNAHPHSDASETIWLVHNGIIENYADLRKELAARGITFYSDTDTEVLAKMIGESYGDGTLLEDAVAHALKKVHGTYGIAVMSKREPEKVVAARKGSPLLIGIAADGYYLSSDATPVLPHTREVVHMEDGDLAVLTPRNYVIRSGSQSISREPELLEWDTEAAQKKGHEHFMLKEIMEIPEVIRNSLRGRLDRDEGRAILGGLRDIGPTLHKIERLIITGCGSAYYAGLVGQELIEEFSGIPVEVEVASEFRYRRFTGESRNTAFLAISQSGETADTLEAVRIAKKNGMLTLGIVNVVGSTIARETDAGVYNHAGPEIGVASTKGFISQVVVLALLALLLGRQRGLSREDGRKLVDTLLALPEMAAETTRRAEAVARIAKELSGAQNALYIGRKYQCPVAYEGALKLKEVSYIHAEGYGAGEMKHGPIALIEPSFPTIAIAPKDSLYAKICSNIEEIRARGGKVIVVTTDHNADVERLTQNILYVPEVHEALLPVLTTIPLQLLAYYVAKDRGLPIDKPRNLAKSVTVE